MGWCTGSNCSYNFKSPNVRYSVINIWCAKEVPGPIPCACKKMNVYSPCYPTYFCHGNSISKEGFVLLASTLHCRKWMYTFILILFWLKTKENFNIYLSSAGDPCISSVGAIIVAQTERTSGSSLNHIMVKENGRGFRWEGKEADPHQQPLDLYRTIIHSLSDKGDWVLDACCGTGKWQLYCVVDWTNMRHIDYWQTGLFSVFVDILCIRWHRGTKVDSVR